jgi:hypothetical protein
MPAEAVLGATPRFKPAQKTDVSRTKPEIHKIGLLTKYIHAACGTRREAPPKQGSIRPLQPKEEFAMATERRLSREMTIFPGSD